MNNEKVYQNIIQKLGLKVANLEVQNAELNTLLEQAQLQINNLIKDAKGGEKIDEGRVTE
ncbi:hypothetical protein [Rummeliibacillus sp. TYF-LIM-RU47]|uniref:hypothetical protein n=1 Tax=Rummeliibacillus sp. TYF-LIM-RU47 TaxID=2608406 RepID=UPI00123AF59F|nr:hypothetical protein [Rummeliibacillus sp. TYF-LIM-RU47]